MKVLWLETPEMVDLVRTQLRTYATNARNAMAVIDSSPSCTAIRGPVNSALERNADLAETLVERLSARD